MYKHKKIHHAQKGWGDIQERPFNEDTAPWKLADGNVDVKMMQEYVINSDTILHKSEEGWFIFLYAITLMNG